MDPSGTPESGDVGWRPLSSSVNGEPTAFSLRQRLLIFDP
jgi:hypothetical protein